MKQKQMSRRIDPQEASLDATLSKYMPLQLWVN